MTLTIASEIPTVRPSPEFETYDQVVNAEGEQAIQRDYSRLVLELLQFFESGPVTLSIGRLARILSIKPTELRSNLRADGLVTRHWRIHHLAKACSQFGITPEFWFMYTPIADHLGLDGLDEDTLHLVLMLNTLSQSGRTRFLQLLHRLSPYPLELEQVWLAIESHEGHREVDWAMSELEYSELHGRGLEELLKASSITLVDLQARTGINIGSLRRVKGGESKPFYLTYWARMLLGFRIHPVAALPQQSSTKQMIEMMYARKNLAMMINAMPDPNRKVVKAVLQGLWHKKEYRLEFYA